MNFSHFTSLCVYMCIDECTRPSSSLTHSSLLLSILFTLFNICILCDFYSTGCLIYQCTLRVKVKREEKKSDTQANWLSEKKRKTSLLNCSLCACACGLFFTWFAFVCCVFLGAKERRMRVNTSEKGVKKESQRKKSKSKSDQWA